MMNNGISFLTNHASVDDIARYLASCDKRFMPALSTRVDINAFAEKISTRAERFEAWSDGQLIGLVATYCNDYETRDAFITYGCVLDGWTRHGVALNLFKKSIDYARQQGMRRIRAEINPNNAKIIGLFQKLNFEFEKESNNSQIVTLGLID
jgi:L-amino acid N-acyltransferase YncA